MLTLIHYLPYLIVATFFALVMVFALSNGGPKRNVHPRPPRQQYYRWDDIKTRRG